MGWMGWMVPSTLDACVTTTARVLGLMRSADVVGIDEPLPVARHQIVADPASLPEVMQGSQDGIMFQLRGDHVVPGPEQSIEGQI